MSSPAPRRRVRRRWFAAAMLLALALSHPLWLTALGDCLVVEDPLPRVESVLILDGDRRFDRAARMLSSGTVREALAYEPRNSWLTQRGVMVSAEALARRELQRRGIAPERVRVLYGAGRDSRSALRALAPRLAANPDARVAVLTDRLGSRSVSVLAARLLGPERRARVAIVPLRDRRFDETSFWRSRAGLKSVSNAIIELVYAWLRPHAPAEPLRDLERHVHALLRPERAQPALPWPAAWLDVGGAPRHVDYAFVMPGDLEYRVATAAAMVRGGLARAILLPTTEAASDVQDGVADDNASATRNVLALLGVGRERVVVLERGSSSTFDDLVALREFLRAAPRARVALVTDRLHTRRTRFIAEQLLGASAARLVYVSSASPALQNQPWWSTASGVAMVTGEYLKLAVYWLRYGSGALWCLLVAAGSAAATVAWRRRRQARAATRS